MALVPFANVAGVIFGILLVPLMLFLLVTRLGLLYPRLGRWIDRRAYQAMPRLGHLFMSDEEVLEERRREQLSPKGDERNSATEAGPATEADPANEAVPASRSVAEEAFGKQQRR